MASKGTEKSTASYGMRETLAVVLIFTAMLGVTVYLGGDQSAAHRNLIGKPAPEIHFQNPQGEPTSLSAQRGTGLLINFWAIWCQPCIEEMPSLRMLESHFQTRLKVLAFHIDEDTNRIRGQVPAGKFPTNLIFDFSRDHLRPYNVRAIPLSILVDPKGLVRKVYTGPRNWMRPEIVSEIESLLRSR